MAEQIDKLISRQALVLLYIARHPTATQRQIARELSLTTRHVAALIRELVGQGVVYRHKEGVRNIYEINEQAHFHHPVLSHLTLARFLEVLGYSGRSHP